MDNDIREERGYIFNVAPPPTVPPEVLCTVYVCLLNIVL